MSATEKETLGFQSEAKQLLHLMIHSLYSNKEIFLRELVSNANDAIDKLRFRALSDPALMEEGVELAIQIDIDEEAGTITVADNGIGMSSDQLKRVAEPFYTTKPSDIGSGMGIAIMLTIVKEHNGKAEIKSQKGFGSEVLIELPLVGKP